MTERGLLIAFEGGDGSGKSTQAALLGERIGAVVTRQPGGTELGRQLRDIILDPSATELSLRTEALLFMTDRAEHVDKLVRPALEHGRHVVTDRWAYSSIAYQGYGRGLSIDELRIIADWSMNGLWPDLVVLLDIPVEVGEARMSDRNGQQYHYELEGAALQRAVTDGYRQMAAAEPDRWVVVNGEGDVDDVALKVWAVVEPLLSQEKS
jgi:dTMP kinase